eukprot:CAMPEP_0172408122 /NCGR_PEP_ID=MMETSP1061-20121228/75686_1 /TAXON_ID=37318 /ORGANISM="Pseudo-nitzschia pungens, Strain cf. pungens" /LENGTH=64 /DNA_ID=CAMNT_0013144241 /DNA_START=460 /DNA_END=654 /DNA_ORIENTATION=-
MAPIHAIDMEDFRHRRTTLRKLKKKLLAIRERIQSDSDSGRVDLDNHILHDFLLFEYERTKNMR